ncbi:MAG: hypothetical protein AAFR50_08395, partial [Pseudomonadota bacterium]
MQANFLFSSPPSPSGQRAEVAQAGMEGGAEAGEGSSFAALVEAMAPMDADKAATSASDEGVDITSQSAQAVPIAAAATPALSGPGTGASAAPLVGPRMAGTALP